MRDDFPKAVRETLAKRVGSKCSNPLCKKPTHGPQEDPGKSINIGVAAHISAASQGGKRYDPNFTPEQRSSIENGIWLCQNCAKLIDSDESDYTIEEIKAWKLVTEREAKRVLESNQLIAGSSVNFAKLETMMPKLLDEMRADFKAQPLARQLILIPKTAVYNPGWGENPLRYYYEEHESLEDKMRILQNCGLIVDVTFNRTRRYEITEEFAEYLTNT